MDSSQVITPLQDAVSSDRIDVAEAILEAAKTGKSETEKKEGGKKKDVISPITHFFVPI